MLVFTKPISAFEKSMTCAHMCSIFQISEIWIHRGKCFERLFDTTRDYPGHCRRLDGYSRAGAVAAIPLIPTPPTPYRKEASRDLPKRYFILGH